MDRTRRIEVREFVMEKVFRLSALMSILAFGLICYFLFANGLPAIGEIGWSNFLLGRDWAPTDSPASFGILPMIMASLYITLGAMVLGLPVGIFTAAFLAKFCPRFLYKVLKPAVSILAGIPSVVYGFFGMITIVPLIRSLFGGTGASILSASILLGLMILPTVISISESALRALPDELYSGALALGTSHERAVFRVLIPAASSSIRAAAVLAMGRAIGETMALVMVAGNQARMPAGLLKGARSLTANIVLEMGYASGLHREALIATGLVLFIFILLINTVLFMVSKEGRR